MRKLALLSTALLVFSLLMNLFLPFQNAFATNDWSKSSLEFIGSGGDCEEIFAEVKNGHDSGAMAGTVQYEVYYIENGNPKNGTIVATGSIGPLEPGETERLTFNPETPGNYMFKAYQEEGHPGTGVLWSDEINVKDCEQQPPPEPELKPLSISDVCTDDPDSSRKWEVHNPNDEPVSIHWKIKNSQQSGEATIGASSTITLETDTVAGDNILVVLYGDNEKVRLKSKGEACEQEPPKPVLEPLVLQSVCTENPDETRKWEVTNPNDEEVTFTWEVESQTGEVTLGADETTSIDTDTEGDNVLYVYVEGLNPTSLESTGEKCENNPPPELDPVELKSVCTQNPDESRKWEVTNPNGEEVTFTWKVASQTGEVTLGANETSTIEAATEGDNVLHVFVDGLEPISLQSSGEKCEDTPPPEELEAIDVSPVCSEDPNDHRVWKITNPNEVSIELTWKIADSEMADTIELDGMETITLKTKVTDGSNQLEIWIDGKLQNSFESSEEKCEDNEEPPEVLEPLVITSQCHEEDATKLVWEITNPNDTNITIMWEILNSDQSGTVELDANASETIHTMIIDGENTLKLSGYGFESVEIKADTDQCEEDEPINEDDDKDEDKDKDQNEENDNNPTTPGTGGQLPNTATPWYNLLLIASLFALGSGGYLLKLKKAW